MLWSITGLIERQKPAVLEISVNHVVNSTLENFSKDRQSGDWPIVGSISSGASFMNGSHGSMFPVRWDCTFGERSIHQKSKRLRKGNSTIFEETSRDVIKTCRLGCFEFFSTPCTRTLPQLLTI